MKTIILSVLILGSSAVFAQEKKTSKGHGSDKHTPANKDYDKPVSKEAGKMQIRKSGNNTNGLADTTSHLSGKEQNTMDRSIESSASSSGSPSTKAEGNGTQADGTNTAQRASYNMAGSPVTMGRRAAEPEVKKDGDKKAQRTTPKKKKKN